MSNTKSYAAQELAILRKMDADSLAEKGEPLEAFSFISRIPRAYKSGAYRLLSKLGLIERSPLNDRFPMSTVWRLTDRARGLQDGEELSAVS